MVSRQKPGDLVDGAEKPVLFSSLKRACVERRHARGLAEVTDESRLPNLFYGRRQGYPDYLTHHASLFREIESAEEGAIHIEHSGHQIHQDEPEKFQSAIIKTLDVI